MDNRKGSIVSKSDFLKGGLYSKEQYEGVLASADPRTGDYNIGVQLSENEVLIVDHADSSQVRDRLQIWHAQAQIFKDNME